MMSHWIIIPVVLPALLAPIIGFVMRYDIVLARVASTFGTVVLLAVSLGLVALAADGDTHIYSLGIGLRLLALCLFWTGCRR